MGKRKHKRTKVPKVDIRSTLEEKEEKTHVNTIWDLYNELRKDAGNNNYQPMMELVHQYYQYNCPSCPKLTEFKSKHFVFTQACREQYCVDSPEKGEKLHCEYSPFHAIIIHRSADEGSIVRWLVENNHCACSRCNRSRYSDQRARKRWRQEDEAYDHYGACD